ncbi:hypothetical protein SCANM63S_03407 [Streptomyces canarius]
MWITAVSGWARGNSGEQGGQGVTVGHVAGGGSDLGVQPVGNRRSRAAHQQQVPDTVRPHQVTGHEAAQHTARPGHQDGAGGVEDGRFRGRGGRHEPGARRRPVDGHFRLARRQRRGHHSHVGGVGGIAVHQDQTARVFRLRGPHQPATAAAARSSRGSRTAILVSVRRGAAR